jgi:hypothetical protein
LPQILDETPDHSRPDLTAVTLARQLRKFADQFRAIDDDPGNLDRWNLCKLAGETVMDSRARGIIPATHNDLMIVVDHYREPEPPYSGPRRTRSPGNLFLDICGGHLAPLDAPVGVATGGLLPRWIGRNCLRLSDCERYAVACEYIADLIARPADPGVSITNASDGPLQSLRIIAKKLRLKGNEATIISALCDEGGKVAVADLAVKCEWVPPYETQWNPARHRLNQKLAPHGWKINTESSEAVAARIPALESERK